MRTGIELMLYESFCRLLHKHDKPKWAVDELDYLIFQAHKDEFWGLSEDKQWEVRTYMKTLRQLLGE